LGIFGFITGYNTAMSRGLFLVCWTREGWRIKLPQTIFRYVS